jgi:hypothetical protein
VRIPCSYLPDTRVLTLPDVVFDAFAQRVMLVTEALTIGQITFILRAAIQILTYAGLFLIGLLILAHTPRVASLKTHDLVNRAVGKASFTQASVKWIWGYMRGRNEGAAESIRLLIAIVLFTLYSLFASLSDIGFLGFYTCSVPGPSVHDYPASIASDNLARSAVLANLVNGTDPSTIKAYRCDSAAVVHFENVTERNCTAWHNSTWADASLFTGVNMTDSDILMPRQLGQYHGLNNFFLGAASSRVENPVVSGGMAIYPHDTGFQAVFGVPQLAPQRKVTLDKAMALEVEVGCMTLGISSANNLDTLSMGTDVFQTNGSWRYYAGPDYLRDVLSHTVDNVRQYYLPLFNKSTLTSNGTMLGINSTTAPLSNLASVNYIALPTVGSTQGSDADTSIFGNCTDTLRQQLNLTVLDADDAVHMCAMLGIGGLVTLDGSLFETLGRMVCASTSQVNMVSATIETDEQSSVSVELTRLPSDLNYVRASYWDTKDEGHNNTEFIDYMPLERYTLSDNPEGPTSHFIVQNEPYLDSGLSAGPGSGGCPLSRAASLIISSDEITLSGAGYTTLTLLDARNNQITFNASIVTQWGGQLSASYLLQSTGFNGWTARDSAPMLVSSTGGKVATCYKPLYAIGFLPLILTAFLVVAWSTVMLVMSAFTGTMRLGELYAGMNPYKGVVNLDSQDTSLIWENEPQPHLDLISAEQLPAMKDRQISAQSYLRAESRTECEILISAWWILFDKLCAPRIVDY